ncbi:hypothetical protein Tco_0567601 [Tanacetum coccineum]
MAPRGRPTRTTRSRPVTATPPPVTTTPPPVTDPTTTTSVTGAQLQAMIDEGVTAVLAARATTRNGDDSHTSGTSARRNERTVRECTYQDFMKCQPLFFRGREGAVNLTQRFERMETVFRISNYTVENQVKFATSVLMEEEARLSRAAWAQSMDACDQTHSEGILLRTTVMTQQSEIVELRAADQRRQTVISELLKADYRRQRQLVRTLKIVEEFKALRCIEIQRQEGT